MFLELCLTLPLIMLVLWGSVAVYHLMEVSFVLNDAAEVGIEAWLNQGTRPQIATAVDLVLTQNHLNPRTVSLTMSSQPTYVTVRLATTVFLPVVGAVPLGASQSSYGPRDWGKPDSTAARAGGDWSLKSRLAGILNRQRVSEKP